MDYYLKNEKGTLKVFLINGFSFSGQAQNAGMAFAVQPWKSVADCAA